MFVLLEFLKVREKEEVLICKFATNLLDFSTVGDKTTDLGVQLATPVRLSMA